MTRSAALELHDDFEGVGAHELNHRFVNVDGYEGFDHTMRYADAKVVPKFVAARGELATSFKIIGVPRLDGVDVSHYQYHTPPNWSQVVSIPTWWAATKFTQSTSYIDPTAERSRVSFYAVGMRHRGLYHWLSSTTPVDQQAAHFIRSVGRVAAGEFLMLDAEEAGITVAQVAIWCALVEEAFQRPVVVYTGAFVAGSTIWQNTSLRQSNYGRRPFILAAYTTEAKARALPGVASYPWQAWQFSSNGPVTGIVGRCDMDRIDDRAAFDLASGLSVGAKPEPPEEDMDVLVTHSESREWEGVLRPPGFIVYALAGGFKKRITGGYLRAMGLAQDDIPENARLTNSELDEIDDAPTAVAGGTMVGAARHGTWTET